MPSRPYDGATVLRLIEDSWHDAAGVPCPYQRPLPSVPVVDAVGGNNGVTKLEFALSSSSAAAVDEAHRKFASFAGITKFHALHFSDFGKAQIKKWRVSPDGYIQMAYQLAHKRLHGTSQISVYESCSTKRKACSSALDSTPTPRGTRSPRPCITAPAVPSFARPHHVDNRWRTHASATSLTRSVLFDRAAGFLRGRTEAIRPTTLVHRLRHQLDPTLRRSLSPAPPS